MRKRFSLNGVTLFLLVVSLVYVGRAHGATLFNCGDEGDRIILVLNGNKSTFQADWSGMGGHPSAKYVKVGPIPLIPTGRNVRIPNESRPYEEFRTYNPNFVIGVNYGDKVYVPRIWFRGRGTPLEESLVTASQGFFTNCESSPL